MTEIRPFLLFGPGPKRRKDLISVTHTSRNFANFNSEMCCAHV